MPFRYHSGTKVALDCMGGLEKILESQYPYMKPESIQKLDEIFRTVFQLPDGADISSVRRNGEVPWDSLTLVTLVAAIESEFNCNIDAADALKLVSYQAAQMLLEEKGV